VAMRQKVVSRFLHTNDQKAVDSLQGKALCSVLSIPKFSHYEPAGTAR